MGRYKLSEAQLQKMLDYGNGKAFHDNRKKQDLQFLFNVNDPENIYVKYTSYGLGDMNEIESELEVICISKNGETSDCYEQFSNMKEKMAFASDFVEIDLDDNGNILM